MSINATVLGLVLLAAVGNAAAEDVREPPYSVKPVIKRAQPYEIVPGTFINLTLTSLSDIMPSAVVSTNVYDHFENVAIPAGSTLLGGYKGKVRGKHIVYWTQIQLPAVAGTLDLPEPLLATMPDGTSGILSFSLGARAGTLTNESFILPHR